MKNAYAAYARDETIRMKSSSGGIFSVLASIVIEHGGVVFGVCFDEHFHAVYEAAEKIEQLDKFRGAKYAVPDLEGVFEKVRSYLDKGKYVLFTGLPCHTAALQNYVSKTKNKTLIIVDLVCHGTPETEVWDAYLDYERVRTGEIRSIKMRDKSNGWPGYCISIENQNGKIRCEDAKRNIFMRGYIADLYLRKPCYKCRFKGSDRGTDLTLGDYWGVSRLHPQMDTGGGVSLVFVHSEKGLRLFKEAEQRIVYSETDVQYACSCNPAVTKSPELPKEREMILEKLRKGESFPECIRPYLRLNIRELLRTIKRETIKYTKKRE